MEKTELIKRAEDLARRCEKSGSVTHSSFLTPAERYELEAWLKMTGTAAVLRGGQAGSERTVAFFLPDWMEPEQLEEAAYIKAIRIRAFFGAPSHRDYMGALLGMGIERDRLGDILVNGEEAYVFCLAGVEKHLLTLDKVGRCGVKSEAAELSEVPYVPKEVRSVSFSVMSLRLDAVVGGMFGLSRSEAARQIGAGNVSVNYSVTLKTDMSIRPGDTITLRGAGKGSVTDIGGTSRRGRTFVNAEILK